MAAPTFNASFLAGTVWTGSTSPSATGSINRATNDVLAAVGGMEDTTNGANSINVTNPTGVTFTRDQEVTTANRCYASVWSGVAASAQNTTVSFSEGTSTTLHWGARVYHWSASDGVGVSNKGDGSGTAPSVTLTGVSANSAIVVAAFDWTAAGGNPTWLTSGVGSFTQVDSFDDGTRYSGWTGYYADVGSAGNKTVGWSTPTNRDWSLVAVEVKGSAASGATVTPAVIAAVAALPQAAVSVAAAPAAVQATVALPGPAVSVGVAPAVIQGIVAAPAAAVSVGAAPAVIPVVVNLPQATPDPGSGNATALPASIAMTVTLPQATVSVGAAPAQITAVVNLPAAAVSVAATPAVIPVTVALPQATVVIGASPTPATIAALVSIPAVQVSIGAAPATIPVTVTFHTPETGAQVNAQSTPTVAGLRTSDPTVLAAIASTAAVTAIATSTPSVSD